MPEDAAYLSRPVRVVIVDDTRSIRAMLRNLLSQSRRIEVVGEAADPFEARDLIRTLNPDVVTLDVVMPRMDGLSFLEKIMSLRPMPVVMVSSRTKENSYEAIRALELGAVDCVDRAQLGDGSQLVDTLLTAAGSNVSAYAPINRKANVPPNDFVWNGRAVVVGSSTGGVDALLKVLADFPANGPPTVIAQHMPKDFLESFTQRLNKHSAPKVVLAEEGSLLEPGFVYIAPGGSVHAAIYRKDPKRLRLIKDQGDQMYIPSVDILFSSAVALGKHVVGVMLTGMGRDGADAMLRMREAGAHTIVQDSESSVVDGMPRSAREIGAAVEVVPLHKIGRQIIDSTNKIKARG